MQSNGQMEQVKLQAQMQIEQFKAQQAMQIEQLKQEFETQRVQMKAQIDAETKIAIAQMTAQAAEKPTANISIDGKEQLTEVGNEVRSMAQESTAGITQAMMMLADAVSRMNKPRRRMLQRGPDGRAMGVIEIEMEEPENGASESETEEE